MLRRKSLDRICQTTQSIQTNHTLQPVQPQQPKFVLPISLRFSDPIFIQTPDTSIQHIYKYIGRIKRLDEKLVSPFTTISCVFDIFFQDFNITNDIINLIDNIISTKDTIDNSITIGLNTRPAIKRRHRAAIIKLIFMIYKLVIYKIVICSLLTKDDHFIRLCIDYINLYLDSIL